MKFYRMKARANRYYITYGYLVQAESKEQAREKLQDYLDAKRLDSTALKTARVATEADHELFKQYPAARIV